MPKVQGRSFTSNTTKLLKHLDKLTNLQQGESPSPVMAHISLTNSCNLTCSFCCFANRKMADCLPLEAVKSALKQFKNIGVLGVEFTGGGEPTLHPNFEEIIRYSKDLGFEIGICTNGSTLGKKITKELAPLFSWVRLGMYGFYENYEYNIEIFEDTNTSISAAYVWDEKVETSNNPNITGEWMSEGGRKLSRNFQNKDKFYNMIDWVEKNKIPTRIAFNAIKDVSIVQEDIKIVREEIKDYELDRNKDCEYAFLSDFNYKGERKNDHCYMHMVKPFLFTDGYIYACPSAELSKENNYNYSSDSQFAVCHWSQIEDHYSQPSYKRSHNCHYCKYAMQNELIDDIVTPTQHNSFA